MNLRSNCSQNRENDTLPSLDKGVFFPIIKVKARRRDGGVAEGRKMLSEIEIFCIKNKGGECS